MPWPKYHSFLRTPSFSDLEVQEEDQEVQEDAPEVQEEDREADHVVVNHDQDPKVAEHAVLQAMAHAKGEFHTKDINAKA